MEGIAYMEKIILSIDGMTCSACSNGLEKYLLKQDGIINASVNLVMSNALVEYDETKLNIKNVEEFVKKAGFKSLGLYTDIKTKNNTKNNKVLFIIFLILSIILMYVSMGHMIGLPTFEFLNMHTHPISYAITLLIITIPFIFYGFDIIKSGFKNLIHKSPNMDTLVAIGVLSSLLYSLYNMYMIIKGNTSYVEHLYFESAAIVIFFIKLGRYIDGASKDKTKEAIQKLVQITPKDATIKVNGEEKKVTIDEINKGDIVVSKPGERVSVDGEIVMMCDDGINDSPALALSDIGVSVNTGTDIARDSSDVILTKNDLTSIMNLINISKKTIRNIKQNLFWAFFYNSLMIPIAMGVLSGIGININPMIASLAMVLSSFTVILNALRLKKIKM